MSDLAKIVMDDDRDDWTYTVNGYCRLLDNDPKEVASRILAWVKRKFPKVEQSNLADNPFYNKMRDW
jgi:hypothetical protein